MHQAIEEYFLTADELGNMIKDFCETFGTEDKQNRKREDHYHLTGSKNTRTGDNDKKLSGIFNTYDVNFIHPIACTILTMKVWPDIESTRFFDSVSIAQERYVQLVTHSVESNWSIWETLKKEKLPTFVNNTKIVKVKINNMDV